MEEETQNAFKSGVRPGLIIGIIMVAITYLVYVINSSLLISGMFGIGTLIGLIGLVVYFGIQYRSEIGGFISFGDSFKFSIVAMVIAGLISTLGMLLLYTLVDPDLPEVLAEEATANTIEMIEKIGGSADAMPPEQLDEIRESTKEGFTAIGQIKGFGISVIFYAVLSLISAAIIKKRDKSLDY